MITVQRNPYHVRQSRSSSPESYSSFSQMGDYGDIDSFKSTLPTKLYNHYDQVCFNNIISETSHLHNNHNHISPSLNNINNHNSNNNHHPLQRNNNHQNHVNNQHNNHESDHQRTPFTISRSYSSNSSLASNDSFKDKRRLPMPPKGHIMYHPSRYKTELCRQWEELGYCEYDDRCLFAHGIYELKPLPNRHPKYKTEKCSAFHDQGFCSFGPRCSFIHSKVDPADLLEKVLTNLPKIPMPKNPEDKENINTIVEPTDDDRLPIFKKIAPSTGSISG